MKFKKLVMIGFKSFADRTEFEFGEGLTALVGPNGCGKSNVVDAIKWVLGEQRPTSLRSKEMGDVIFNGNATRKSMGYCEVSLHIDNRDRKLAADADELVVTRKVYRDGGSEYFVNKTPSRLKDVRNIFLDTGIGVDNYSVIEQGQIDKVLTSNAFERRLLFEEAAGISKFRVRRKETERKLEHTEQNLLRLRDVIDELGKRVQSVKRQAAKARRYQEIYLEVKEKRTLMALRDYSEFTAGLSDTVGRLTQLEEQATRAGTSIDTLQAGIAQAEQRLQELDEEFSRASARVYEYEGLLKNCDVVIETNKDSIERIKVEKTHAQNQIEEFNKRLAELEGRIAAADAETRRAEDDLQRRIDEIQHATQALELQQNAQRDSVKAVDDKRDEIFDIERDRSAEHNKLLTLQAHRESLRAQRASVEKRIEELEHHRTVLGDRSRQIRVSVEDTEKEIAELERELAGLETTRDRCGEQLDALKMRHEDIRHALSARNSRHDLLRDLVERLDGMNSGVQKILSAEFKPQFKGVLNVMANCIDVDKQYARAIEAALGARASMLVAGSMEKLPAYLDTFRQVGEGRVTFLALDAVAALGKRWDDLQLPAGDGVLGAARSFVRCDGAYDSLVQYLLGDVVVVDTMQTALRLAKPGMAHAIVALDGTFVDKDYTVSCGQSGEGSSLILHRSEMRELEREIAHYDAELALTAQQRDAKRAELDATLEALKNHRQTIYERHIAMLESKNEIKGLQKEETDLQRNEELCAKDLQRFDGELHEQVEQEKQFKAAVERVEERLRHCQHDLERLKAAALEKEKAALDAQSALTALKVNTAEFREKRESLKQNLQHLRAESADKQALREGMKAKLQEDDKRRAQLQQEIHEKEQLIKDYQEAKDEAEGARNGVREERERVREQLGHDREAGRAAQDTLRGVEQELNDLRIRKNDVELRVENLKTRMLEDYQIDLSQRIAVFKPEEHAATDWEQLRNEITEGRKKLENLGNVNLDSLQELDELEQRFNFMSQQEQDLVKAKESLLQVIETINQTCLERFTKTFNDIRANFQELFRKLFNGGKGDIVLIDEVNPLESGIEITARPPGKLPKSLTLLSGGEKAMTTVALLFAIFRSRPSPFCVLDEVDAPLDESNIDRFVGMLREYIAETQFLIITHNKRTMAVNDRIYGVTQQESGVSKKISVHFEAEVA